MEERAVMEAIQRDYNLKLEFAMDNGEYVSDVDVDISDLGGEAVVGETTNGPWFLAALPAGGYKVSVSYEGRTVTRSVKVGNGLLTHVFHW